jgi:hypothetical protein
MNCRSSSLAPIGVGTSSPASRAAAEFSSVLSKEDVSSIAFSYSRSAQYTIDVVTPASLNDSGSVALASARTQMRSSCSRGGLLAIPCTNVTWGMAGS